MKRYRIKTLSSNGNPVALSEPYYKISRAMAKRARMQKQNPNNTYEIVEDEQQ